MARLIIFFSSLLLHPHCIFLCASLPIFINLPSYLFLWPWLRCFYLCSCLYFRCISLLLLRFWSHFSVCIFPYVSSQYSAGTLTPWALANLWTTCDASKSTTASPSPLASCSRTWPRPTRSFTTKSDDAIYLLNMAQAAAAIYNAIAAMAAILEICFKFSVDRP